MAFQNTLHRPCPTLSQALSNTQRNSESLLWLGTPDPPRRRHRLGQNGTPLGPHLQRSPPRSFKKTKRLHFFLYLSRERFAHAGQSLAQFEMAVKSRANARGLALDSSPQKGRELRTYPEAASGSPSGGLSVLLSVQPQYRFAIPLVFENGRDSVG